MAASKGYGWTFDLRGFYKYPKLLTQFIYVACLRDRLLVDYEFTWRGFGVVYLVMEGKTMTHFSSYLVSMI